MGSVKLKDLKAFVRYDGSGRVVAGSLVFRKKKPKNGRWQEITKNLCCNPNPTPSTTTTTTTSGGGGGTQPTAFIQSYYLNTFNSCNSTTDGSLLFYSASSTLSAGVTVFTDAALTNPVNEGYVILYQAAPMEYIRYLVGTGGTLSVFDCATSPTITINYVAPGQTNADINFSFSNSTPNPTVIVGVCADVVPTPTVMSPWSNSTMDTVTSPNTLNINAMSSGTTYYAKAYITVGMTTYYSSLATFTTN